MAEKLFFYFFKFLRNLGNLLSFGGRFILPQSLLRRLFRYSNANVCIDDFDGELKVRLNLSEHMQRRIFWMGYYSNDIVGLIDFLLKPGMVVVDVGANIGEISMVAARRVGASGKVVSFEPVTAIADQLTEHVKINNLSQIMVVRKALGQITREHMPIYASCGQTVPDEHHGLASLYGEDQGGAIDYVTMTTLDQATADLALDRVDLLKIDIEGGELPCLKGAEQLLRRWHPMIIVEVQDFSARKAGWSVDELFSYLQGFGYEFFAIGKKGRLERLRAEEVTEFQNVFCRFSGKTVE